MSQVSACPYRVGGYNGRAEGRARGQWFLQEQTDIAKMAGKQKMQCSLFTLKAIMPHRVFQHIATWAHNFFHSTSAFVDLECWYNPDILSASNCWTFFNIHL